MLISIVDNPLFKHRKSGVGITVVQPHENPLLDDRQGKSGIQVLENLLPMHGNSILRTH